MPDYVYSDGEHRQEEHHRMLYTTAILCDECGSEMHRVPQPVAVTWGGNPPSNGGINPLVRQMNATRDRRRDEFARKKEEHVKRTENES